MAEEILSADVLMERYPYYVMPDIKALAVVKDPEQLARHRRRIAANIGDPDALRALLGDASEDFYDFYGTSELPELTTEATIDSFLEKFGKHPEASRTTEETVPVDPPAIDYASRLEKEMAGKSEMEVPADATLGAIDSFLSAQPSSRIRPKKEVKEMEKPSLTESFAKILIKNGNYSRALEIITQISLNNPEKSIYFADQIRFLKKVISLESR